MLMFLNCWRKLGELEQRYTHWEEMKTPHGKTPQSSDRPPFIKLCVCVCALHVTS